MVRVAGLNGAVYLTPPKLSSKKDVLRPRYKLDSTRRYELTLEVVEISATEKKLGKAFGKDKARKTEFCQLKFCGEDKSLFIKATSWGRYVSTIKRLLTVGAVFRISFIPTESYPDLEASDIEYCISLSGKKSKLSNAGPVEYLTHKRSASTTSEKSVKKAKKAKKESKASKDGELNLEHDGAREKRKGSTSSKSSRASKASNSSKKGNKKKPQRDESEEEEIEDGQNLLEHSSESSEEESSGNESSAPESEKTYESSSAEDN